MWRNLEFRRLWLANSVSSLGTQVTFLALPLTAISVLAAEPLELGILTACGTLPYLVVGLPAGVWTDRLRRKPILLMADIGRAVLLGLIPLLAWLGVLNIVHLYLIAFLTGTLSLFYDVAEEAYLPTIVENEELVAGNSQLAAIDTGAELIAPVVAGGLVQLLTAPIAVGLDALSFVWSAFWLGQIEKEEVAPAGNPNSNAWQEIKEGLTYLLNNPYLRAPMLTGLQWQLFGGMNDALLILFLTELLGLPAIAIGLMYAVGSLSALLLTPFSSWLTERFGPGRVVIGAGISLGCGWLIVLTASGQSWSAFAIIAVGMLFAGAGNMLWNVNDRTIRQVITPNQLLGRVNASGLFLTWGALPVGSLLGGLLGEWLGVRQTLLLSGLGVLTGVLWVIFSPVRTLEKLPTENS